MSVFGTFLFCSWLLVNSHQLSDQDNEQEVAAGQYLGTGGLTMVGQMVPMLQVAFNIISITINNNSKINDKVSYHITLKVVFDFQVCFRVLVTQRWRSCSGWTSITASSSPGPSTTLSWPLRTFQNFLGVIAVGGHEEYNSQNFNLILIFAKGPISVTISISNININIQYQWPLA